MPVLTGLSMRRPTTRKPKKDKPKEAREKFLKQLLLRESEERKTTHDELVQVCWSSLPFVLDTVYTVTDRDTHREWGYGVLGWLLVADAADQRAHPERAEGAASVPARECSRVIR